MMARIIRLMLACMALAGAPATHAMQASDMAPCAPNATHETHRLESFLIVHVECSDVLLEIPVSMLGRSILVYIEFDAMSTGASEFAPGSAIQSNAVRWVRTGNKVGVVDG